MSHVALKALVEMAEEALAGCEDGAPLDAGEAALIRFGLASSVTALLPDAVEDAIATALANGVSVAQLQEVASLVSGLGFHTLMATAVPLARAAGIAERPLSTEEQALWERYVGDDVFWDGFERALPGFLGSMLRLSPDQFVAFFDYCAVPWKSGTVRARVKELAAMACDATPAHRFLPGFRLHLHNAIALGAGRAQIMAVLTMAGDTPPHDGF